jgi:hypothetical protein
MCHNWLVFDTFSPFFRLYQSGDFFIEITVNISLHGNVSFREVLSQNCCHL